MNSIVAHWPLRNKQMRDEIRSEVRRRYEKEWKAAGIFRRLAIWLRIEREIRRELRRRFPPGALYVRVCSR